MMGSLLLAVWLDFLHLSDIALKQRFYSVEKLFADMWRWQEMLEPAMTALSSREHAQLEAAARDVPPLVGHLTGEFAATVEEMHVAAENLQKVWNRMIMKVLYEAETRAGRMLTRNEILNIVAERMEDYYIPMNLIPWRGP